MKSNAKSKIIILITLGILFALSPIITINLSFITGKSNKSSDYSDGFNLDKENLKISAVSGKIHIENNWTAAKSAGICTGNGTYSEPYVIEDLIIDGGGSGSCILISNSDVYFKIENCSVFNSGGYPDAGIRLLNVNNSRLINNSCSSNYRGIFLEYCNNNSVTGNTANDNTKFGIILWGSDFNGILGNIANNNYDGIALSYSNNNNITGNTANNNSYGIDLLNCDNNIISGNSANNIDKRGISLSNIDNSIISGNTANNNSYGLYLINCDNDTISGNTVNNNGHGIFLGYSNNNNISGNIANYNSYGIRLVGWSYNVVSGNIMNDCGLGVWGSLEMLASHDIDTTNLVNGKPLYYYTNEVNLRPINFTNAGQVILVNCKDSLILNLNISHSSDGISLYYCNNNNISGNTANDNTKFGIFLWGSDFNGILGNTANNNSYGIGVFDSNNTMISGNTVNNNDYGIFLSYSNNNNIYLNCLINNTLNAYDNGSNNQWDNGIKGNYWSDYTGLDADGNGIGDVPYNINGSAGSQDNFPLMKCPLPLKGTGRIPFELIALISIISGGAVIGVAILLLIRRKRKGI